MDKLDLTDEDMRRILLASSGARPRYDSGKHERVDVEIQVW